MLAVGEWKSQTARFPLFHSHDGDYGMIYPPNPDVYGVRILRTRSVIWNTSLLPKSCSNEHHQDVIASNL
jgi:hypothetical protein